MKPKPRTALAGPRKLICIHSGTCDYAEIDVSEPVQLVAANNVGKTALISTLQFLYLDEDRSLDFGSHSPTASKQFYFPKPTSYILFECDTLASGIITICLRSAGPAAGYDFERYWFRGPYDRADFLDADNLPRSFEHVKKRLSDREFLKVEDYSEYRSLLGAVDHKTKHSWGLVPLEDPKHYQRFRKTFQRLLRLRDLTQDQLKDLLADCAGLRAQDREIDLAKDSTAQMAAIEKTRLEIKALEAAEASIRQARALYTEEVQVRSNAHQLTRKLRERCALWNQEYQQSINALNGVADETRGALGTLRTDKQSLEKTQGENQRKLGVVDENLQAIAKGRDLYATFQPELAEVAGKNLKEHWLELDARLRVLPTGTIEDITEYLKGLNGQLAVVNKQIEHQGKLIVTWLRTQLPSEDVNRLGALLRSDLLESVLDEQVFIKDSGALINNLCLLAERCDARGYEDDAVTVEFPTGALRHAAELGQIERLEKRRTTLEVDIEKARKEIETLTSFVSLKEEAHKRETAYKAAETELNDFKAWTEECKKEARWLEEKAGYESEIERLNAALAVNEENRIKAQDTLNATAIKSTDLGRANNFITQQIEKGLPVAEGDDPGQTLSDNIELPPELKDWFRFIRSYCDSHRNGRELLLNKMANLSGVFAAASFGYDPSATIEERLDKLEAEIDALPERRRETNNQWLGVLRTSRASFTQILNGLRALQQKCQELNRHFGALEFSSIKKIDLKLYEHEAELSVYHRFRDQGGDPSLFEAPEEATKRFDALRTELERRPKLQLSNLFGLRFEVTRNDGVKNLYDKFEQVESTGTTVVLKVVLNLIVLKDLLHEGKARIPFHLDEVLELDHHNLANILTLSESLGFVGIFAAPEFAVGPRVFVHMVPNEAKRLIIDERHRQEIIEEPQEATEATP
jgi:hypothetical protein